MGTGAWGLRRAEDIASGVPRPSSSSAGAGLDDQIPFKQCVLSTMTLNCIGWWEPF